ncbi:hypothetical protein [Tenacibaculum jejuense]|uniref:Uncharacterized protein n=1 Tax=Tenacibaculum jejuense TaxID=584609 RepID=A0A238UEB3_9FLAO|nr:hypothetical protein [Tenacibaculum jejuense]SNR16750.1 conserved protein of unknown function [Tenacibaculum jejuense]
MKKTNIILLIILCIIGVSNLIKVFTLDNHLKNAKESLQKAQDEVENAQQLNSKAQKEIQGLKTVVEKYEFQNEALQLEIDSIVLNKRAKAPKDWAERQSIKKKQQEITARLEYLRQKNNEFE